MPRSAMTSPEHLQSWVGVVMPNFLRQSLAAMATANSLSRPGVVERILINRLGQHGDGIADSSEGPIYIPGPLPGKTVKVDTEPGHPDRRRLVNVQQSSELRIEPICRHFGVCGGCAMQHLREEAYRSWKRDLVVTALCQGGVEV